MAKKRKRMKIKPNKVEKKKKSISFEKEQRPKKKIKKINEYRELENKLEEVERYK